MTIGIGDIIIWIIVGGFAGSVVGAVARGKKEGYGKWKNFLIGLIGAAVGGVVFDLFKIDFGFDLKITFEDVVSALLGSFVLLFVLWFVKKKKKGKKKMS